MEQVGVQTPRSIDAICTISVVGCGSSDNDGKKLVVDHKINKIDGHGQEFDPVDLNNINLSPYFTVFAEIEFCPYGCDSAEIEPTFGNVEGENKSIAQNNLQILDNAEFTDCVFKIGDDEIRAHRCFLAKHSDVFRTMFSQPSMIEAEKGIIEVMDSNYISVGIIK
ncbi:unnamed protein product [Anisakis simplex]|uniref:BTB domain-containing protein n=1 Tax=Anisakis simplex TaxID=6269 RepID=A0A0M3IZL6_ANISI|nr:unnamed protein product [Anisakis simplex]